MLRNQLRPPRAARVPLARPRAGDAKAVGAGLPYFLATCASPGAGVAEWAAAYPAAGELCALHPWFAPMVDVVATRLLGDVEWGRLLPAARRDALAVRLL